MKPPRALTGAEVSHLISQLLPGTPLSVSAHLALFCGLRLQEFSRCTRSDISRSLRTGLWSVRKEIAKYGKTRTIPVSPFLASELQSWINYHDTFNVRHLRLWNCSVRTVQRRFAELFSSSSLPGHTPHDLRHTFACALYDSCRDLSLVQAVLGHRDLKTTLIYVHVDGILQEEISKMYDRFVSLPSRQRYGVK